jgi:hypothetical protein
MNFECIYKVAKGDCKSEDVTACRSILWDLKEKLSNRLFDDSSIEKLLDELMPPLLSILLLDRWECDLHEVTADTLLNLLTAALRLNIPFDKQKVENVLVKRIKKANDDIDKDRDLYTLHHYRTVFDVAFILLNLSLASTSQTTIREFNRLEKWPFAENESIRSMATQVLKKINSEIRSNLVAAEKCMHYWSFEEYDWEHSGYTIRKGWPNCRKCGANLFDFIDLLDISKQDRAKNNSIESIMRKRHEYVLSLLMSEATAKWGPNAPPGWHRPIQDYLQFENIPLALTIPQVGPIQLPFFRMIGWRLYWQGGFDLMSKVITEMCRDPKLLYLHGELDQGWGKIGLDRDYWMS